MAARLGWGQAQRVIRVQDSPNSLFIAICPKTRAWDAPGVSAPEGCSLCCSVAAAAAAAPQSSSRGGAAMADLAALRALLDESDDEATTRRGP